MLDDNLLGSRSRTSQKRSGRDLEVIHIRSGRDPDWSRSIRKWPGWDPDWSQCDPEVIQKWSGSDPYQIRKKSGLIRINPEVTRMRSGSTPMWSGSDPEVIRKWSISDPEEIWIDPDQSGSDPDEIRINPNVIRKWSRSDPEEIRKWSGRDPEVIRKRSGRDQKWSRSHPECFYPIQIRSRSGTSMSDPEQFCCLVQIQNRSISDEEQI